MDLAPDITAEDLDLFLQETEEHLQILNGGVLRLEREGAASETLQEVFRAVHTLKGSSGMLGFTPMARLSHATESLLDQMRRGSLTASPRVIGALLQSFDTLRRLTDFLTDPDGSSIEVADTMALLREASGEEAGLLPRSVAGPSGEGPARRSLALSDRHLRSAHAALVAGDRVLRLDVSMNQEISWPAVRCYQIIIELEHLGNVIASTPSVEELDAGEDVGFKLVALLSTSHDDASIRESLTSIPEVAGIDIVPFQAQQGTAPNRAPGPAAAQNAARSPATPQTMRVDIARLDSLASNIGELVIERARLLHVAKMLEAHDRDSELAQSLNKTAWRIDHTVTELREDARKLRMLPVDVALNSFPRMMRDLAQKMNKRVNFVIDGEQTEIDRSVVDRLRDPLVHLLRNAIDHGVEAPEVRKAAGKPEEATIRISARQEQSHVVVVVEDDGKGIDPAALRRAAVEKGLLGAEVAGLLSDAKAIDLMFLPGNSTAQTTTDISGRGVGMDVVKTDVEAINGSISVRTEVGKGSAFTVKLPLTLATLQVMLVTAGEQTFAVPSVHIVETAFLNDGDVSDDGKTLLLQDRTMPLIGIGRVFGGQTWHDAPEGRRQLVVVHSGDDYLALEVDSFLGQREVVARPMAEYVGEVPHLAGATILDDGHVAFIADVPSLVTWASQQGPRAA